MNYIDVDDKSTYPKELIDYVNKQINYQEPINVSEDLIEKIKSYNIVVYHCTRVLDKNTFWEYGILIPNNSLDLKNILKKSCYDSNIDKIDKEVLKHRGNTIHFVFSMKKLKEETGLIPFFEHIGGEIIECVDNYKESRKGNPYIVKFIICLNQLEYIHFLVEKMIQFYLNDKIVEYEDFIWKKVESKDIIDIIDATEIFNNLKEMI